MVTFCHFIITLGLFLSLYCHFIVTFCHSWSLFVTLLSLFDSSVSLFVTLSSSSIQNSFLNFLFVFQLLLISVTYVAMVQYCHLKNTSFCQMIFYFNIHCYIIVKAVAKILIVIIIITMVILQTLVYFCALDRWCNRACYKIQNYFKWTFQSFHNQNKNHFESLTHV